MSVRIQHVQADDFESWLALWKQYQNFYQVQIDPSVSEQTWARLCNPAEPMYSVLAWSQGQAIGMVNWIFHRSTWTTGDYCYLQDLYVSPEARNLSVGRQLIEHVYQDAEKHQCSRVYWLTHESNQDAMHLYEKVADRSGFIQYRKQL